MKYFMVMKYMGSGGNSEGSRIIKTADELRERFCPKRPEYRVACFPGSGMPAYCEHFVAGRMPEEAAHRNIDANLYGSGGRPGTLRMGQNAAKRAAKMAAAGYEPVPLADEPEMAEENQRILLSYYSSALQALVRESLARKEIIKTLGVSTPGRLHDVLLFARWDLEQKKYEYYSRFVLKKRA